MKNKAIKSLILLIMTTLSVSVFGQYNSDPQTGNAAVLKSSKYEYTVDFTEGNSYQWTVTKGGVAVTEGIENADTHTVTITWNGIGTYEVKVVETSANSCTTTKTFAVEVKDNDFEVVWDINDWCTADKQCAVKDFTITFKLSEGKYPATMTFKLLDEDNTDHGNGKTITSNEQGEFSISITDFVVKLGHDDYVTPFEILSLTDKYGVEPTNIDAVKTHNLTIHRYPNTSDIQHN